jgi:hypothetical protein
MTLMKALIPSTILTLIVSAIVGSSGSAGGVLDFESATLNGYSFTWSWPFFLGVMALNSCIVAQMAKEAKV